MDFRFKTFFLLMLLCTPAWAKHIYAPHICNSPETTYLEVKNTSNNDYAFWIDQKNEIINDEIRFISEKRSTTYHALANFLSTQNSFNIKVYSNSVHFKVLCKDAQTPFEMELTEHNSPIYEYKVNYHYPEIHITNLFPTTDLTENNTLKSEDKTVEFIALSKSGVALKSWKHAIGNYYENKKFLLELPRSSYTLVIKAKNRISVYIKEQSKFINPTPVIQKLNPDLNKKYFLLTSKSLTESYVVALTDAQQIETARYLIQHPESEKIIVGRASVANTQFNRNFIRKDKSPFSWEIAQVTSFADFAHIDCDGSPEIFEDRILEKMNYGSGAICFWSYRIMKELTPEQVASGKL